MNGMNTKMLCVQYACEQTILFLKLRKYNKFTL